MAQERIRRKGTLGAVNLEQWPGGENVSDQPSAQEQVYLAVQARGYVDPYPPYTLLARQIAKLSEELAEAASHIEVENTSGEVLPWFDFQNAVGRAALDGKDLFDNPAAWGRAWLLDDTGEGGAALRKELADCQVVLLMAAEALVRATGEPFDVVQAAVRKATADVSRGVRGG